MKDNAEGDVAEYRLERLKIELARLANGCRSEAALANAAAILGGGDPADAASG